MTDCKRETDSSSSSGETSPLTDTLQTLIRRLRDREARLRREEFSARKAEAYEAASYIRGRADQIVLTLAELATIGTRVTAEPQPINPLKMIGELEIALWGQKDNTWNREQLERVMGQLRQWAAPPTGDQA